MSGNHETSRFDLVTSLTKAVAALAHALLARGSSDAAVALVDTAVTLETDVVLSRDHVDAHATTLLAQLDALRGADALTDRIERCCALARSLRAATERMHGHPCARLPSA